MCTCHSHAQGRCQLAMQVPDCVVDAVASHMRNDCAQLGAGYGASNRATETVSAAHTFMEVRTPCACWLVNMELSALVCKLLQHASLRVCIGWEVCADGRVQV